MRYSLDSSLQSAELDWAALARYLAGDSAPEELERVRVWLGEDIGRRQQLEFLRTMWRESETLAAAGAGELSVDAERFLERLHGRREQPIGAGYVPSLPATTAQRIGRAGQRDARRARLVSWKAVGAVMATCSFIATAFIWHHAQSERAGTMARYATASGERATISLGHGNRMILAPGSHARVTTGRVQDVVLDGEAFFQIKNQTSHPFTVHTQNIATRVLGTDFSVRRFAEDRGTRVVVVTGKVSVIGRTTMTVAAGSLAYVDDSTATTTSTSDAASYVRWVDGELVFRDTPVADVLTSLGRWYNLDVRLGDTTLQSQRITATFNRETPSQVVETLCGLLNARAFASSANSAKTIVILHAEHRKTPAPTKSQLDPTRANSPRHMEVGQ